MINVDRQKKRFVVEFLVTKVGMDILFILIVNYVSSHPRESSDVQ